MSELVLVETISIIKHRYVVEVPDGKAEWALDTVTMEEAKEFSQTFINEDIIGFYEDNSDKEGNLLVDGFESKNEFLKDYIEGIKSWIE